VVCDKICFVQRPSAVYGRHLQVVAERFLLLFIHSFLGAWNPYQEAILSVGKVLDAYDTDKSYPVYGFGAKVL